MTSRTVDSLNNETDAGKEFTGINRKGIILYVRTVNDSNAILEMAMKLPEFNTKFFHRYNRSVIINAVCDGLTG